MISLETLNSMTNTDFVGSLAAIFEHSPWVAERALATRPLNSRLELTTAMRRVVSAASMQEQLTLIRAHPRLGARKFHHVKLTEASTNEQRRAGLDAMSEIQVADLLRLNTEYERKFSFPFILAVRGHAPVSILAAIKRRLENNVDEEHATALEQIGLIGAYRLAELVTSPGAKEIQAMASLLAKERQRSGSLLHEWMLVAGLVAERNDTALFGHAASSPAVVLGVYQRPTGSLCLDGALGVLTGIAVAHSINQGATTATRGVAVLADLRAVNEASVFPPARLHLGPDVDLASLYSLANIPRQSPLGTPRYRVLVAEAAQSSEGSAVSLEELEGGITMLERLLRPE